VPASVLNSAVRIGTGNRITVGLAAIASVASLAGCGGADYKYLSSDDGHLYAKVPRSWIVENEGQVAYSLLQTDGNVGLGFTADDSTTPWRADFSLGPHDGSKPFGWVESQHVDARSRDVSIDQIVTALQLGGDKMEKERFTRHDGVEGLRVGYWVPRDGKDPIKVEGVFLMDDRHAAVYFGVIGCVEKCVARYRDQIESVLSTVTVKP